MKSSKRHIDAAIVLDYPAVLRCAHDNQLLILSHNQSNISIIMFSGGKSLISIHISLVTFSLHLRNHVPGNVQLHAISLAAVLPS